MGKYRGVQYFISLLIVVFMKILPFTVIVFVIVLCTSCAKGIKLSSEKFHNEGLQQNTIYRISEPVDLGGETIKLPLNCTLIFENGGSIKNGAIIGNNTKIEYSSPFIGDGIIIENCKISGKKRIIDKEVFIRVAHTQYEIQTLFDLGDGNKIEFSKGSYKNVEKIIINNNVDADFNNSTINLAFDNYHVGECFYMKPWVNMNLDYVKIKDVNIVGKLHGVSSSKHRSCIQLFYVSEVVLDGISIDQYYGGPNVYKSDGSDLEDKTRIGTNIVNIIKYDKCVITNCRTNDLNKEIFWCVPNTNPNNITYFTNNKSTCSFTNGSASFFTLLDGRCVVKNNEVYNYNGSAFNALCYDSEISNNKFYDGKRSIAIDLTEDAMYRAKNIYVHHNECINSKGLLSAFGENIRIEQNYWENSIRQDGRQFYAISIYTRGDRIPEGCYVGCDNNPELESGSNDIRIYDNVFVNYSSEVNVRCALLYGRNIVFSRNRMIGFNTPVIEYVEGNIFKFSENTIKSSKHDDYPELVISKSSDINVVNNTFSRNCKTSKLCYTVFILCAEGQLYYKGNIINDEDLSNDLEYVPCYVRNYANLQEAIIFINTSLKSLKVSPGLDSKIVLLKTNIQ